jgi:heat shock protein HslJ
MRLLACAAIAALFVLAPPARAQSGVDWDGAIWLVEDIMGRGVIDNAQTTLRIEPDGTASGSTGCNPFHGKATFAKNRIRFGHMAVTLRACPPALADQERKFLDALGKTRAARLDERGRLKLVSATSAALLTLTKMLVREAIWLGRSRKASQLFALSRLRRAKAL